MNFDQRSKWIDDIKEWKNFQHDNGKVKRLCEDREKWEEVTIYL